MIEKLSTKKVITRNSISNFSILKRPEDGLYQSVEEEND
jgi:hypothetical protein